MEKVEQKGWRPKFSEAIKNRLVQYRASRDTIPVLNFDLPIDNYEGSLPQSLSPKAKEICNRRRYGARVGRAFKRYDLRRRLSFLLPEEDALLRNLLHIEYLKDQRELDLIAKAKPFSPIPAAHLELVEFDQQQREKFETNLFERFQKHDIPPGILTICTEELNQSLFKLAREIKIADMRNQPVETRKEFTKRAIVLGQSRILEIHQMLKV